MTTGMTIMVMRAVDRSKPRRVGVAEAKSHLARLLREAPSGPTVIHNRGRDVAVVLSVHDYEDLSAARERGPAGRRLMASLGEWRARFGGFDFAPDRAAIVPRSWKPTGR